MEQQARVIRLVDGQTAMVAVQRKSACSGDCHTCHGCPHPEETVVVSAGNPLGAEAGDEVVIRSATGRVLKLAMMLYLMPLALFFLGYFQAGGGEGRRMAFGGMLFALGIGVCVVVSRQMKKSGREMEFSIVRILRD